MANEDDYMLISGIQRFAFCRREWALTHIEQQWAESVFTTEGNIMHERAHDVAQDEKRGDLIVTRGLRIFSHRLCVTGACDVVEFHADPSGVPLFGRKGLWKPIPVEYKLGKPKEHDADELQLCAQAMCLEEMLVCDVPEGFLYYGTPHRRTSVSFTPELRARVSEMLAEMNALYARGYTPRVKPTKACKNCSLNDLCLPGLTGPDARVYIQQHIKEAD